jgi:uncharacterized membrane protein
MDLSLLGNALLSRRAGRDKLLASTAAAAGVTLLDLAAARRLIGAGAPRARAAQAKGLPARASIQINCSPEEAFRLWRDFRNLPRFMRYLEAVRALDDKRSHWVAKAPDGSRIEWDAELVNEIQGELLEWRALRGGVSHSGTVRFARAPGGRGAVVRVEARLDLPGVAFPTHGATELALKQDLRHLKQVLETGVITTTEGQSAGRRGVAGRYLRRLEGALQ